MDERPVQMADIRAAVEKSNEEAKEAIENGTLVPDPEETQAPIEDPKAAAGLVPDEPVEGGTTKVALVGPGQNKNGRIYDPVLEKQKLRNDVLSFMDLTYVSLSARRKSVKDNMDTLTKNKKFIEEVRKSVAEETGDTTMNDQIIAMNMGMDGDFLDKYGDLMAEGNILIRILDEISKRFPEEKRKSVMFVSRSMVQSCKVQIATLQAKYPHGERSLDIKKLENIAAAYADRQDAGPIMNKLSYGHNVLKHLKRLKDMDPKKLLEEINRQTSDIFKDKNMASFRQLLTRLRLETMNEEAKSDEKVVSLTAVVALFLTHWLGYSYRQEEENGRSGYFKTFIMNVYDYYSKDMIFDIPGGKESFKLTVQLVFACFETAMALLTEKMGFKAMVEKYNGAYVAYGAAYTAQMATVLKDAEAPEDKSYVRDYLTDEMIDEIVDSVYNWVHLTDKEVKANDVDGNPETTSVKEPAETGGEDDIPDSDEVGEDAPEANEAELGGNEPNGSNEPEGEAEPEGAAPDAAQPADADGQVQVQLQGGGAPAGGSFRYTSNVSHRDRRGRLPGDVQGVPESAPQAGAVSSEAPTADEGAVRQMEGRDRGSDAAVCVDKATSDKAGSSDVSPADPGVPNVSGRDGSDDHIPEHDGAVPASSEATVGRGLSRPITQRLPIADAPEEDIHEQVQKELADGDDTPATVKPTRRGAVN